MQQFVPSKVCLSCDGCCRFKEAGSVWRPKITNDEIDTMGRRDLLSTIYSKKNVESSGHIKTSSCNSGSEHFCSSFAPGTKTCTIYEFRPFECQLDPFVLTRTNGKVVVVVHHHCPFIRDKRNAPEFVEYVNYLKEYFKKEEVLEFIQRNPTLVGEYDEYIDELEYLFTVYQ